MYPSPLLPTDSNLTGPQKWRLARRMTVIYYPVLLYLKYLLLGYTWGQVGQALPAAALGTGAMLFALRGWVSAVEWLQNRLARWLDADFSTTMRWPGQLLTVSLCVALAGVFVFVLGVALEGGEALLAALGRAEPAVPPDVRYRWHRALDGYFFMLMLSVFYLLANGRGQLRLAALRLRSQELEAENVRGQLTALQHQVSPHFLFNSLSILSSLVRVDVALAEQFIDRLARAYRYTLEQQQHDVVPLHTELAFLESYTFLLKIRFAEKFDVLLDVPAASRSTHGIAPLTLQLLLENAVKHNTMSRARPLLVHIGLEGETLVVRNPLQPRPTRFTSTGVGLANIRRRYQLLSPHPVEVIEAGTHFEVRIPLLPV